MKFPYLRLPCVVRPSGLPPPFRAASPSSRDFACDATYSGMRSAACALETVRDLAGTPEEFAAVERDAARKGGGRPEGLTPQVAWKG